MEIENIYKILGLTRDNGLFIINENRWQGVLSQRTEKILETIIKPDAFFLFNNEPLILFFQSPGNRGEIFRHCWNFNQSPIIFIVTDSDIEIYNGLSFNKSTNQAELLSNENWQTDFSYFNIISGQTWEKYRQQLAFEKRVDEKLLGNIQAVRNLLIEKHHLPAIITNSLIGRLLFLRYLIDRNVVIGFTSENDGKLTNSALCEILKCKEETYRLFDYIRGKFNGNLFPVIEAEKEQIAEKHLKIFIDLLQGIEITSGQMSLFDIYNFSIIPIELISNIYEFFIGKPEQEKKGAYYTPLFIVNSVLTETVNQYFQDNPNEYNCKILDPACGSGVFLVEALRKIITQYQKNTPDYQSNLQSYKTRLKQLLTDNIFGIDKDENAINIAIFSLYVTLLDYLQPPEIVDFQFPPLLKTNFFTDDFFNLDADFNLKLDKEKQTFNFIIGNPPWGKIADSVDLYEKYWKDREKTETEREKNINPHFKGKIEIKVSRKEIAQAFLIRVSDFQFNECAFVITSKVLYNLNAKTFRKYFLENFTVRKIFEMSSIRHEIFDKSNDPSSCPASILYYSYSPDKEKNKQNLVTHISLKPNRFFEIFRMFVIEKHDQKQLLQSYFMEYDWIWKVMVYGNVLDFFFTKRLFAHKKLNEILKVNEKFIFGKGICINGGDKNPIGELAQIPDFVDASQKALKPFYIFFSSNKIVDLEFVHRPRKIVLFRGPLLLVKKGFDSQFRAVSAVTEKDCVFTDAITSIKAMNTTNLPFLNILSTIFHSSFFSYFMLSISSSIGIEREQGHDEEEKFSLPIPFDPDKRPKMLLEKAFQIGKFAAQKYNTETDDLEKEKINVEYDKILKEIDAEILRIYQITDSEKALIDYAHEISIPLIQRRDKNRIFGALNLQNQAHKDYLTAYARIFIEHYNHIYNSDNHYFEVEVWHSNYMIGMYFKIISQPSEAENQIIWKKDENTDNLLKKFAAISISNRSQNLFVQKDIKGFEENAFYVVKPNEYKCWHRAMAYLDLSEFMKAIMDSAKQDHNL